MATKRSDKLKKDASESIADVIMSIRIEGDLRERLRKLAFDKRIPMRDFIVKGIERVLHEEKY